MLARAACAPRICLTCRLSYAKHITGARVPRVPRYGDAARRRHASNSTAAENQDIFGKLTSERRVDAPEKSKSKTRPGRKQQLGWGGEKEEDPFAVQDEVPDKEPPFDWRADPLDELQPPEAPIRSASEPDEAYPIGHERHRPWKETNRTPTEHIKRDNTSTRAESDTEDLSEVLATTEDPKPDIPEAKDPATKPDWFSIKPEFTTPKPRQFQHDYLRQQHLNVDALGQSVNALIIKNPSQLGRPASELAFSPEPIAAQNDLDWKSILPEKVNDVDAAKESIKNIEELRPTETSVLPRVGFEDLQKRLITDFTGNQLKIYSNLRNSLEKKSTAASYSWLESQKEWKSSNPQERETGMRKQRQALQIMTTHWGLQIQEEVEHPGSTSVVVSPQVFRLITHPSIGVLEALSTEILDESIGETITPNAETRTLDIYTRKAAVPAILLRIHDLQSMMVTRSVSLQYVGFGFTRSDILAELGRITRTILVYNENKARLEVSWIPDQDQPVNIEERLEDKDLQSKNKEQAAGNENRSALSTEDPSDIVARLIRWRPSQRRGTDEQIIAQNYKNASEINTSGMLVPHCRENRSMSWRHKLRQWERFVLPTGRQSKQQSKKLRLSERVKLPTVEMNEGEVTHITATFGHLLHTKPEAGERKQKHNPGRIIAPVLPHPASFTNFVPENESDLTKRSSIVLNFMPHFSLSSTQMKSAPEIRFTMPVDSNGDLSKFSVPDNSTLNVINHQNTRDLLLPDESVDVRIAQESENPLDISAQEEFRQFLAASEFNLVGGQLRTPSTTNFLIPRPWPAEKAKDSSIVKAPYMFAGLEIHQELDLAWKGYTLRYSSVEAGKHGGSRAELALVSDKFQGGKDGKTGPKQHAEFLSLLEEAVEGKYWSWHEGFKQANDLPDAHDPIWKRVTAPETGMLPEELAEEVIGEEVLDEDSEFIDEDGFVEDEESLSEDTIVAEAFAVTGEECKTILNSGRDLARTVRGALVGSGVDLPASETPMEETADKIDVEKGDELRTDEEYDDPQDSLTIGDTCELMLSRGEGLAAVVQNALDSQAPRERSDASPSSQAQAVGEEEEATRDDTAERAGNP